MKSNKFNRNKAYQIIINDKIDDIVHAHNTDSLVNLLMYGWTPLNEWSDEELKNYLDGIAN